MSDLCQNKDVMACLTLFTNFVTNQGTSSCAADCSERSAKYRIAGNTAQDSASSCTDLRIGWVGSATSQGEQGSGGN